MNKAEKEKVKREEREEIIEFLRQWRIAFANRPIKDRKDAFAEVYEIEKELAKPLNK